LILSKFPNVQCKRKEGRLEKIGRYLGEAVDGQSNCQNFSNHLIEITVFLVKPLSRLQNI
jgi:hypothetical protein